jgi:hypothetical protein
MAAVEGNPRHIQTTDRNSNVCLTKNQQESGSFPHPQPGKHAGLMPGFSISNTRPFPSELSMTDGAASRSVPRNK